MIYLQVSLSLSSAANYQMDLCGKQVITLLLTSQGLMNSFIICIPFMIFTLVHIYIFDLFFQGNGRRLIGTFSATDLRGCHHAVLQTWLPLTALEFTQQVLTSPLFSESNTTQQRELVTCQVDSPLSEVIGKALTKHVHRVWVVDQQRLLLGLVSLTDMIRVLRTSILADFQ